MAGQNLIRWADHILDAPLRQPSGRCRLQCSVTEETTPDSECCWLASAVVRHDITGQDSLD